MIDWKQVPWTLWAYAGVVLVSVISVVLSAPGPIVARALFAVIMLVWLYLLLKGIRWVWVVTVVIYAVGGSADLVSSTFGWRTAFGLFSVVLLLLPITRRYFFAPTAASNH